MPPSRLRLVRIEIWRLFKCSRHLHLLRKFQFFLHLHLLLLLFWNQNDGIQHLERQGVNHTFLHGMSHFRGRWNALGFIFFLLVHTLLRASSCRLERWRRFFLFQDSFLCFEGLQEEGGWILYCVNSRELIWSTVWRFFWLVVFLMDFLLASEWGIELWLETRWMSVILCFKLVWQLQWRFRNLFPPISVLFSDVRQANIFSGLSCNSVRLLLEVFIDLVDL